MLEYIIWLIIISLLIFFIINCNNLPIVNYPRSIPIAQVEPITPNRTIENEIITNPIIENPIIETPIVENTIVANPIVIDENTRRYRSIGEEYCCKALEFILNTNVINNIRMNEMRNPNTGRNLELDCWAPEYRIAVEYDGINHRQFVPHFHGTIEKFHKVQANDRLKDILSTNANINLIRVSDLVDCYNENGRKDTDKSKRFLRIYNYLQDKLTPYITTQ